MSLTTDQNDPRLKDGQKNDTGQHDIYLVLSEEERAKGFVRPYRDSYIHRGKEVPANDEGVTLVQLSDDEKSKPYNSEYVAKLEYSDAYREKHNKGSVCGKMLTQKELDAFNNGGKFVGGCGTVTRMGRALSETYARDPKFYGATFCCGCNKHLPVGEFVWDGTNETVGS